jgi:hypothetical protein
MGIGQRLFLNRPKLLSKLYLMEDAFGDIGLLWGGLGERGWQHELIFIISIATLVNGKQVGNVPII